MLSWRRIGMAILWFVGGGLQGIVWIGTLLASVGFTAGLGLFVSYIRDMPAPLFWVLIVVAFILFFATLNHLAARSSRRQERHDVQPSIPTIGHANNVYLNQPTATQADEEKKGAGSDFPDTKEWRAEIRAHSFDRYPLGTSRFTDTETYVEMWPYLPPKIRERFESQVGAALSFAGPEHLRGREGDRRVLLREVARIEEERGLL